MGQSRDARHGTAIGSGSWSKHASPVRLVSSCSAIDQLESTDLISLSYPTSFVFTWKGSELNVMGFLLLTKVDALDNMFSD